MDSVTPGELSPLWSRATWGRVKLRHCRFRTETPQLDDGRGGQEVFLSWAILEEGLPWTMVPAPVWGAMGPFWELFSS